MSVTADEWAAMTDWSAQRAILIFGAQSSAVAAARAHTDIPIHVYDPGGGEAAPGVTIHTTIPEYRAAAMKYAMLDVGVAAFAPTEECDRLGEEEFQAWEDCTQNAFASAEVERNTEERFGERWAYCAIETMRRARGAVLVGGALAAAKGVPMIVAGSGPSIEAAVPALGAWKGKGLILASLTAVGALERHNVTPDIVLASDANERLYDIAAAGMDVRSMVLCGGLHIDPRLWDLPWRDRMLCLHALSGFGPWLSERLGVSLTPIAGTVTGMGVGAALQFGARPIILIGQDCAYGSQADALRYHAQGAATDYITPLVGRDRFGNEAIIAEGRAVAPLVRLPRWGGQGEVISSALFEHYRQWFVRAAVDTHAVDATYPLINASVGGAEIEGWRSLPVDRVIPQAANPWGTILESRRLANAEADDVLAGVAETAAELADAAAESAAAFRAYIASQERVEATGRKAILAVLASKPTVRAQRKQGARKGDPSGTIQGCVNAVEVGARAVAAMAAGSGGHGNAAAA